MRFHRIRIPLIWILTSWLLLSDVARKNVVFRARFGLLWLYIISTYMPFLGVFIGFFSFYRRIFCAETALFVDVPIIGYYMLRYVEFLALRSLPV